MAARRNMQFFSDNSLLYNLEGLRIYSLLRIFQGTTKADVTSLPLYPDYSRKTAGVCLNTAISVLEGSDGVFILAYAEGDDFPSISDLPSRVSD